MPEHLWLRLKTGVPFGWHVCNDNPKESRGETNFAQKKSETMQNEKGEAGNRVVIAHDSVSDVRKQYFVIFRCWCWCGFTR